MNGFRLRPEQQRVIDEYRDGYAAISAVPGAGKTTTLSALAAELIGRIGPRQRVMIVTYQNAAVANFQRAVSQRLDERGMPPRGFVVRTLHSLALEVLSSVRHRAELDTETQVIEEADHTDILKRAVATAIDRHRDVLQSLVVDAEGSRSAGWPDGENWLLEKVAEMAIVELRPHLDDLQRLHAFQPDGPSWLPFVLDAVETYQRELRERGFLSFDDMPLRAVRSLEASPELCQRLRKRWPYILEDEAQDSSPAQERMLRLIAGEGGNLVRVGDPNQAILTTFTSSSVEGFRRWLEDPGVQQFELAGSSRSTEIILRLANAFVHEIQRGFPVEEVRSTALRRQSIDPVIIDGVRQNPPTPGGPRIGLDSRVFQRTEDEQADVVRKAVAYLNRNPNSTVAILVGSRDVGYKYALSACEMYPDEKIIRLLSGKDGRPVGLIGRLLPILDFLQRPELGMKLVNGLEGWHGHEPESQVLTALRQFASANRGSLDRVLYPGDGQSSQSVLGLPPDLAAHEVQMLELLRAVSGWLENRLSEPRELLALIGATIGIADDERQLFDSVASTVAGVEPDPSKDRLEQLRTVLEELQKRQRRMRGTPQEYEIRIDPGTLTISTRHQAKGLEWDVVFAVGCDDYWFRGSLDFSRPYELDYLGPTEPQLAARTEIRWALAGSPGSPTSADLVEVTERQAIEESAEGLRVMYVTLTRARRALWLSWHEDGTQGFRRKQRYESLVFQLLADLITDMRLEASSVAAD